MTTLSASLRLRPTRIGFLTDPQDADSLRRIFQVCTSLWGGVYNPIIPVCTDVPAVWTDRPPFVSPSPSELAQGYVSFFEPDVFVETRPGLAAQLSIRPAEIDFHTPRVVGLDTFFKSDKRGGATMPFGTDIFHLYKRLYEREYRFVRRHEHGAAIFGKDGVNSLFLDAAFGGFPSTGQLASLAQAYERAFGPAQLAPIPANWVRAIREGLRLPLHFTRHELTRGDYGWNEPTLCIADPANTLDLIDLWNIRLFRPQVLPVNLNWLGDLKQFLGEYIRANHRPLPGNPHGVMIQSTLQFGRSISEDRVKAAILAAGLNELPRESWTLKPWYDDIWRSSLDDVIVRPQRAEITAVTTDLELVVTRNGADISCGFKSLAPEFAEPYGHGAAAWVNILRLGGYGYDGEHALALTLPSSFTDKHRPGLRMGDMMLVTREGLVLPQRYKDKREYLRLMSGRDAFIAWLNDTGVQATPSDPGRIADQILASLKGFRGVSLLADQDTLRLLNNMSKSARHSRDGNVEEFPDRSVGVQRWQALVHRRAQVPLAPRATLDDFVNANVLRLGLVLDCPNCRKKNWFGVGSLQQQLTCERCLKTFAFPQGSLNFKRTPWEYRVVGPYSVPNYAAGAYGTVLALRVFAEGFDPFDTSVTYSTALDLRIGGEKPFEVDFTLWYRRGGPFGGKEEPSMVFGEAKSFATEAFRRDDVSRLQTLSKRFPGAFVTFATMKDTLSDAEKEAIGHLALWGREPLTDGRPRCPVVVLTRTELFFGWSIHHAWEAAGGQRTKLVEPPSVRLDNLWTFADLTQQVYLGLPDKHARLRALHSASRQADQG